MMTAPIRTTIASALALATVFGAALDASAKSGPKLTTNQEFVEQAVRAPDLDMTNMMAVLDYVLASLPDRVTVYPTENYYYFKFIHGHVQYAGNIRLDVNERDHGKVNFAYFEDLTEWQGEPQVNHKLLGPEDGVKVEKLAKLSYRVSHGNRGVIFDFVDLSSAKPPAKLLAPGEKYIGTVFDESAMRFFLVFNEKLKVFHYILDETVRVADVLVPSSYSERVLIGKRTGFAYYKEHNIDRKILIGVHESNSRVNNYFDGPFDQLPDNFIEGEVLRDAILAVEPSLKGKIDRLGISPGGADRYMIAPYRHYRTEEDLYVFHACAVNRDLPADLYYGCFLFEEQDPGAEGPMEGSEGATQDESGAPPMRPATNPAKSDKTAPGQ